MCWIHHLFKHHLKVTHTKKNDDKKNINDGDEYDKAEKLPITTKKPILKINLFSKLNKSATTINKDKLSTSGNNNNNTWNKKQSNSEELSYDDDEEEENDDDDDEKDTGNNNYLPEYPNIEVIRLEMEDEDDEVDSIDDLNLRYVLFKDRLIVSKNAFH